MSEEQPREVMIGSTKPDLPGHSLQFARLFPAPPPPGSNLLLWNGERKTVAKSSTIDVGQGQGATASASVLHALGCKSEKLVKFRVASSSDWWKHAPGGKQAISVLVADAVVLAGAVLVAMLSVFESPAVPLIVVLVSAVLFFLVYLTARSRAKGMLEAA